MNFGWLLFALGWITGLAGMIILGLGGIAPIAYCLYGWGGMALLAGLWLMWREVRR